MPGVLARIDEKGSPKAAVWVMGAVIAALVLIGDVKTTWTFSAFTVLIYYGITNLSALCLPHDARRFPNWVAWAGLVACFGLAFFVEWQIWVAGLTLLGGGFVFRLILSRHGDGL